MKKKITATTLRKRPQLKHNLTAVASFISFSTQGDTLIKTKKRKIMHRELIYVQHKFRHVSTRLRLGGFHSTHRARVDSQKKNQNPILSLLNACSQDIMQRTWKSYYTIPYLPAQKSAVSSLIKQPAQPVVLFLKHMAFVLSQHPETLYRQDDLCHLLNHSILCLQRAKRRVKEFLKSKLFEYEFNKQSLDSGSQCCSS